MGISTFGANFLQGLGLYETEQHAAFAFGACAAAGGMLGTPLGGVLTDLATRSSLRSAGVSSKDGGDRARHVEMKTITGNTSSTVLLFIHSAKIARRTLVYSVVHSCALRSYYCRTTVARLSYYCAPLCTSGTITVMITVGSVLLLVAILLLHQSRYPPPFLVLLVLGIATASATASGISRVAMLLVPLRMRSFAMAVLTLNLHAFGDVPSPPIIGAVAGAWAPSCMGKPRPSCLGADPEDTSQPYTHDQYGVLAVLLFTTVYMFTSTLY